MKRPILIILVIFAIARNYVKCDESDVSEASSIGKERLYYGSRMASYMYTSVEPCDDFYQYACGNFFNVNKEESSHGIFGSISLLVKNLASTLHEMLMEPVNGTTAADKARYYYQSCMQENIFDYRKSDAYLKLIESLGGWPLLDPNWQEENFDWFNVSSTIKSYGVDVIFYEYAFLLDGSSRLGVEKFGLFPMDDDELYRPFSRDYQLNREVSRQILMMYGLSRTEAYKAFKEIMVFGKNLQSLRQKLKFRVYGERDKMTLDELEEFTPELDWRAYYSTVYDDEQLESMTVTVSDKSLLKQLPHLFYGRNIKRAANYFMLKMLFKLHDELSQPKYKKKYCMSKLKETMGPVVTAMFLDSKYHEKHIEDEILAMASYIRNAFKDSIKSANWLDKETRKGALRKVNAIEIVIGDSQLTLDMEKFDKDFSNVDISLENGFHQNHLNLRRFAAKNDPRRRPFKVIYGVDVNAFYNSLENHLIIPAGIFRRPFYYPELPKAYNFAVIGSILGHEFTHSLDSDQIYRDETGKDVDWFSEEYEKRMKCFVEQYDKYRMEETLKNIHGELTLPENISDNGGIKHSFYGYKKWLEANIGSLDMNRQILPGLNLTDTQLFFLSFAQTWCEKIKGYKEHNMYSQDSHTPAKWRVIGTLVNFDEFSKAYSCEEGSPMNPQEKCIIW